MVTVGKEAGKIGIFVALVALAAWVTKRTEGTWFGNIFFRQSEKKEVK